MASPDQLEAMIVSRDRIIAKVLEVFVGAESGQSYADAVAKIDALIRDAAEELGG